MVTYANPQIILVISLLWAMILEGLLVERGKGYIKFRFSHAQFKNTRKGFWIYIIELVLISILITNYLSKTIEFLLNNYFIWTIAGSFLASYIKFHYEIYGTSGLGVLWNDIKNATKK